MYSFLRLSSSTLLILYSVLCYAQQQKNNTQLFFEFHSGFRGNLASHSTQGSTLHNWSLGDKTIFSPAWNFRFSTGFQPKKFPLITFIQVGRQEFVNTHLVGIYPTSPSNPYPPFKVRYKFTELGLKLAYEALNKNNHSLLFHSACNALFIRNVYPKQLENVNPFGYHKSQNGDDSTRYIFATNGISTLTQNISFQLEFGLDYRYSFYKNGYFSFRAAWQTGITNLLNTSASFWESTFDFPTYNNTSFSMNKGDGLLLNAGIGYRLPIKGKAKQI